MRALIILAFFTMALTGCASTSSLEGLLLTPEQSVYRLGSGDVIKVTVYGEERLTGNYPVTGQGNVAFPLIGELKAEGKTILEFERLLRDSLAAGFVNDPSVTAEVANFRPYFILGEVARPGEFAFADGLTIFSAVARAGGFTYRADQRRIFIRHKNDTTERLYRLDGGTPVQPGDTIRVAERAF